MSQPQSSVDCWVGWNRIERPSCFEQCDMGRLLGHCACVWAWGPLWTGWKPYYVGRFDETCQGQPSCSRMHVQYRIWLCRHCSGGLGLDVPKQIWSNTASFHSCVPLSSLFSMDSSIECYTPILCPQRIMQSYIRDRYYAATERASPASWTLWRWISMWPLIRSFAWSPDQKSMRPRRSATRCQVITHNAVKLPCDIKVGYGINTFACLIGYPFIVCTMMYISILRKRSMRNFYARAFSTGQKSSSIPWVARCNKVHSCWRNFWTPVYEACGCLHTIPNIVLTPPSIPVYYLPPTTLVVRHL